MTETALDPNQAALLKMFEKKKDGRFSAGDIQTKLGLKPKAGAAAKMEAAEADQMLTDLIEKGLITVTGVKEGHHPRPKASYRLTEKGRHQNRPSQPDHSTELLAYQEAFILLQIFRSKEQKLTRSELNGKLKTVAAKGQLEFNVKDAPETVDYALAMLVEQDDIVKHRQGNSVSYTLHPEKGIAALVKTGQHEAVSFTMSGKTLNLLLEAARSSAPAASQVEEPEPADEIETEQTPKAQPLQAHDITKYVDKLRHEKYAGKDLIPIHEVRRLVLEDHGADAAGHRAFDPLIKQMRSDGQLRLIAISDNRDATQEQLDNSIPGMNEILFYIVIQ